MHIQIDDKYLAMLKEAITPFLTGQQVYLFGSRATGTAKKYSDIDLCLKKGSAEELLNFAQMAELKESLSESDLPYFVDVIQKEQIIESFYTAIQSDLIFLF